MDEATRHEIVDDNEPMEPMVVALIGVAIILALSLIVGFLVAAGWEALTEANRHRLTLEGADEVDTVSNGLGWFCGASVLIIGVVVYVPFLYSKAKRKMQNYRRTH